MTHSEDTKRLFEELKARLKSDAPAGEVLDAIRLLRAELGVVREGQ